MDAWRVTLLAMFVLLAVSLAAMTWLVLREQRLREHAGLREWTIGLGLQTLAWPLFAVPVQTLLGSIVQALACALLVAGYAAMLRALLRSLPRTPARTSLSWAALYLPSTLLLLALLWPAQAPEQRIAMFWAAALATVLLAARAPLRRRGHRPWPERALVVLFVGAALVCVYRLAEQGWRPQSGPNFSGITPGQQLALAYFLVAPVFATFAFLLLQLERRQRWLEDLAAEDALTGVHNRRAFFEAAQQRLTGTREDGMAALLMIDVDGFKAVNDAHGHAAGDGVLAGVARRLQAIAREDELVGRFGGDEFCMLLTGGGVGDAAERAERLRTRLAAHPPVVDGRAMAVTLSIGIAHVREGRAPDLDALLALADRRLYLAKRTGRNRVIDRDIEIALPAPA